MTIPRESRPARTGLSRRALAPATGAGGLLLLAALACGPGCAMEMVFQRSGYHQGGARPPDCALQIYAAPPGRLGQDYVELGRVEWRARSAWMRDSRSSGTMLDRDDFIRWARPLACGAGGSGLILGTQGWAGHHYATVIVLRQGGASSSPPPGPPPTGKPPAAPGPKTRAP